MNKRLSNSATNEQIKVFSKILESMAEEQPDVNKLSDSIIEVSKKLYNDKISSELLEASQNDYALFLAKAVLCEVEKKVNESSS